MHVLVVPSAYPTEGHSLDGVFFREQARALHKRGLVVGVIYPDHRSLAGTGRMDLFRNLFRVRVADDGGVPTFRSTYPAAPKLPRVRGKIWLSQLDLLFARYVAEHGRPDLIHAHGILWAGVGAARMGGSEGIPVVLTAHSSSFARRLVRDWEAEHISTALRSVESVVAVSRSLRGELVRYAPEVQIDVIPNLVDTDFFTPGPPRDTTGFTWLAVALLTENKGIATLLEAFEGAFGDQPDVQLRIAGDGPELPKLRVLAERSDVADRVIFAGRLTREAVSYTHLRAHETTSLI